MPWPPAAVPGVARSGPCRTCCRRRAAGFPGAGPCLSSPTAPSAAGPHIGYDLHKLDKEPEVVKEAVEAIRNRKEDHSLETGSLMASLFDNPIGHAIGDWYMCIQVDPDRCKKCGECVRLCPQQNITMGEKAAVMGKDCIQCLACLHGCPYQAITVRGRVVLKEDQWRHPGVTVQELEREA